MTYYTQADVPVRWVFFDNATFDVLKWIPEETLVEVREPRARMLIVRYKH